MAKGTPLTVLAPMRIEQLAIKRGAITATVLRTGMGPQKATSFAADPTRHAIAAGAPVAVVGVAGALVDDLKPGDVVVADSLVSTDGTISVDLPGAPLVASALAAAGIPSRVGPLSCAHVIIKGAAAPGSPSSPARSARRARCWSRTSPTWPPTRRTSSAGTASPSSPTR
jgi:4-hydroxy-3-methylbut-2-enyl diphosphate reductase